MPTVKIMTGLVSVELDANESSIDALGKQAIGLLADALNALPAHREVGYGTQVIERRPTFDAHMPLSAGGAQ